MRTKEKLDLCSALLAERGLTVAFAESATAGSVAASFSKTRFSGKILKGGIVCYDACLKEDLLGVPKALIEMYTPESMEVTRYISENLKTLIEADIYVGITGLTKPGGSESRTKPVGTIFIVLCHGDKLTLDRSVFSGTEEDVVEKTVARVAELLTRNVAKIGLEMVTPVKRPIYYRSLSHIN